MRKIFELLILFQFKHFFADYPLQIEYMLGKFKKRGWQLPLAAHGLIHAAMTIIIASCFTNNHLLPFYLGLFDFTIHCTMDRIKADPVMLGRWQTLTKDTFSTATLAQRWGNKFYWWAIGFDQMVHHFTHYVIIYILLKSP